MVKGLLIANVAVFAFGFLFQPYMEALFPYLALTLWGLEHGMIWQLVTYMFLHGSFMHILFNMLGLLFFGAEMERLFGSVRFAILYLMAGIVGGIGWIIIDGGLVPCIGASGAVYGVLFAFCAIYPQRKLTILLYFIPVTLKSMTLAIVIVVGSIAMMAIGGGNIAHSAHLAGGVVGFIYGAYFIRKQSPAGSTVGGRRKNALPAREEIDRILDKIKAEGIHSITEKERNTLRRYADTGR